MPCPFSWRKIFCASPNVLCQTKNLFTYCASHKYFGKLAYELPKRILILKKFDDLFLDFFYLFNFLKSFG